MTGHLVNTGLERIVLRLKDIPIERYPMAQFVYINSVTGPQPQIWHEKPYVSAGHAAEPLQVVDLPADQVGLSIADLEALYPYKGDGT